MTYEFSILFDDQRKTLNIFAYYNESRPNTDRLCQVTYNLKVSFTAMTEKLTI